MPEGDTIFRTAGTLRRWLSGREITAVYGPGLPAEVAQRLVGERVEGVEARGKHVLVRFGSGLVLHSHMRMTGSWHVYSRGEQWRRPERQARLVLEVGERLAVCFNAPVVELLTQREALLHPSLQGHGPDVLVETLDLNEVRRRARARDPELTVGEVLLDQRVVAGIGNVYRCEVLFLQGIDPSTPVGDLDDRTLDGLVSTAARLMRANLVAVGRDLGAGPDQPWVYRRASLPCRRCGSLIRSKRLGDQARTTYWCPHCQVRPSSALRPNSGGSEESPIGEE